MKKGHLFSVCVFILSLIWFRIGWAEAVSTFPIDAGTYMDHYYYVYYIGGSYDDAIKYCRSLGGHLAVITSRGEDEYLFRYIRSKNYENVYFGFSDHETEGRWKWVNGESSNYTHWAKGEPSGLLEDYAMYYKGYKSGEWNDGTFGFWSSGPNDKTFICEWDSNPMDLSFRISYVLNGGTNNSLNPDRYTPAGGLKLLDPSRSGYEFSGWYLEGEKITEIPKRTLGDITLRAAWTEAQTDSGESQTPPRQPLEVREILPPTTVYPADAGEYRGHRYYVYNIGGTYDDAIEYCKAIGGHLAVITDQGENDYLYRYIRSKGYGNVYFGLTDQDSENVWKWVNGETSSYTNWAFGEPNGFGEDYAMFYENYTNGKWNDGSFGGIAEESGDKHFICEWDSDPLNYAFNITYILNGMTSNSPNPIRYTPAAGLALKDPSRPGFTFKGWYSGDDKVTEIPKGTLGDFILEARWVGTDNSGFSETGKPQHFTVMGRYKDTATKAINRFIAVYSDAFFTAHRSSELQKDLARLSMLAAAAAYDTSFAGILMENCGYFQTRIINKVTETDNDHVSATVGIRRTGDTTIAAIWVKGTSGNYEWISNFNLGTGDTHAGFSIAEQELLEQAEAYLKKEGVLKENGDLNGNVKFWLTGHSRGAAVANLLAKDLSVKHGNENVYAYTFAASRVSTKAVNTEKIYNNIFNYLHPGDFVTEVAPKAWGYYRYGRDINLSPISEAAMKTRFRATTGMAYEGYTEAEKQSLLDAFLQYAGSSIRSYYKPTCRITLNGQKVDASPAVLFQKGVGYLLASNEKNSNDGLTVALQIGAADSKAALVMGQLVIDGKLSNKFPHAHTQAGYLCWLEVIY